MTLNSRLKRVLRPVISVVFSITLVFTLLPASSGFAQPLAQDNSLWQLQNDAALESMLSEGDYVEGEVLAIVDNTLSSDGLGALSTSATGDLLYSAKTLLDASGKSLADALGVSVEQLDEEDLALSPLFSWSDVKDLTNYQWGYANNNQAIKTSGKALGFDVAAPNWATFRTTPGSTNATGSIAIIDSGVDYTHNDLAPIMRNDMNVLAPGFGGGPHGYNALTGAADAGDPMDGNGHGTHCAGIVIAEWNDFGTSGIAAGARHRG